MQCVNPVAQDGAFLASAPFAWDAQSARAAALLSGSEPLATARRLSPWAVALELGVTARSVRAWMAHPGFASEVGRMARERAEALAGSGIRDKQVRLQQIADRFELAMGVVRARQLAYDPFERETAIAAGEEGVPDLDVDGSRVPGAATGLVAVDRKMIGRGEDSREVVVGKFDADLLAELRAMEQHVAREQGEWAPDVAVTNNVKLYAGVNIDAL